MSINDIYFKHLEDYGLSYDYKESFLSYDESTLFCPAGMQQYKKQFNDENYTSETVGNIQRCLRLNDLDSIGDGTHFGIFEMLGLFSFRHRTVEWTIDFWMDFLRKLNIRPDYVTVHPDTDWWRLYQKYGIEVKDDKECTWSDGEIGGYCTEFYKDGIEIGNIVNPLGTCIDCGFGKERIDYIVNKTQNMNSDEQLKIIVDELIKSGIIPSNKEHGYVLRKLLRKCWKNGILVDHQFYKEECIRQTKNLERYNRIKDKNKDKSKEWWFDTHGIDISDYE